MKNDIRKSADLQCKLDVKRAKLTAGWKFDLRNNDLQETSILRTIYGSISSLRELMSFAVQSCKKYCDRFVGDSRFKILLLV